VEFNVSRLPNSVFHLLGFCGEFGSIVELMDDDCGAISGINEWQGKPKYLETSCSSGALFAALLDEGSSPVRRGGKPETTHLSYDTAAHKV
jgi:hypothetical protein